MKKVLLTLFLSLMFCNISFAESYYFKECKLSENASGDYLIDFDKNHIKVTLKAKDGTVQKLTDKIKLVTKDQIISKIIKSGSGADNYFQYYLNADAKSVTKQIYKKIKSFLINFFMKIIT